MSILCLVIQGALFCRSGPEAFRKKGAQMTFGKNGRQVEHTRGHIYFLVGFAGGVIFQLRPQSLSQQRRPMDFLGIVECRLSTRGDISIFLRVLQGSSFCRSGPEAFRQTIAQVTFWEKRKAGQADEGTYLVFAGSCRGRHFPE